MDTNIFRVPGSSKSNNNLPSTRCHPTGVLVPVPVPYAVSQRHCWSFRNEILHSAKISLNRVLLLMAVLLLIVLAPCSNTRVSRSKEWGDSSPYKEDDLAFQQKYVVVCMPVFYLCFLNYTTYYSVVSFALGYLEGLSFSTKSSSDIVRFSTLLV
jgi:hypothetical protein